MIAITLVTLVANAAAEAPPCSGLPKVKVCESLTDGKTKAATPRGKGRFTADGWNVVDESSQLRFDLGAFHKQATIEFEVKGPLDQAEKRVLFAAWPDPVASESVEQKEKQRKAAFHQIRVQQHGMMLRLTYRPAGKSHEGLVPDMKLAADRWYKVKGTWNTGGGDSVLYLDGKEIQRGKFNAAFPGFRYVFLGRDNYRAEMSKGIAGLTFRNFRVYAAE